jgi:hypothetical protein
VQSTEQIGSGVAWVTPRREPARHMHARSAGSGWDGGGDVTSARPLRPRPYPSSILLAVSEPLKGQGMATATCSARSTTTCDVHVAVARAVRGELIQQTSRSSRPRRRSIHPSP